MDGGCPESRQSPPGFQNLAGLFYDPRASKLGAPPSLACLSFYLAWPSLPASAAAELAAVVRQASLVLRTGQVHTE